MIVERQPNKKMKKTSYMYYQKENHMPVLCEKLKQFNIRKEIKKKPRLVKRKGNKMKEFNLRKTQSNPNMRAR